MKELKLIDVKNVEIANTHHNVDVRKLFSSKHATIVLITLKTGEALIT